MASDSRKPDAFPFAQAMGQAKQAAEDFARMFTDMKMPGLPDMAKMPDMSALMTAQQRNMEAFAAANRIALEGAQAVAQRQMEIMQQSIPASAAAEHISPATAYSARTGEPWWPNGWWRPPATDW